MVLQRKWSGFEALREDFASQAAAVLAASAPAAPAAAGGAGGGSLSPDFF